MALGTLDRTPPPFFKQGPSAFTRLMFFSSVAIFLMVADVRFQVTQPLRATVASVLHPVQQALLVPGALWGQAGYYLTGLDEARRAQTEAERVVAVQAERVMRSQQLEVENSRLRELLGLRPRVQVPTLAAEVLFDAPDPYTRKVVVDRGAKHGVSLGSPVVDERGVLGQVTRIYPLSSEVTLVIDRESAVPVLNARTQQRGIAYGVPQSGGMELRFMAGNADVQVGDILNTSGLDGVYPTGLPVARVLKVDRRADSAFAKIALEPLSRPDHPRHLLLLQPVSQQVPVAQPEMAASVAERASMAARPASEAAPPSSGVGRTAP